MVDKLPDTSELKTAARGGVWDIKTRMLSEIANESYRFRASYHAAHSTNENDVRFDPTEWEFVDPVIAAARAELEAAEAEIAEQTVPELADAGWI